MARWTASHRELLPVASLVDMLREGSTRMSNWLARLLAIDPRQRRPGDGDERQQERQQPERDDGRQPSPAHVGRADVRPDADAREQGRGEQQQGQRDHAPDGGPERRGRVDEGPGVPPDHERATRAHTLAVT